MEDLIKRQDAIDAFDKQVWGAIDIPICKEIRSAVKKTIEQLPSAQPEIIRCKDCKFWTHIKRTNRYWCKTDDGLYDLNPSPDDFCSRAERRTDE